MTRAVHPVEVTAEAYGTSGADVSDVLLAELDALTPGTNARFPTKGSVGRYHVDKSLLLDGYDDVWLDGSLSNQPILYTDLTGPEVVPPIAFRPMVNVSNSTDVRIAGLAVHGANRRYPNDGYSEIDATTETNHGIYLENTTNARLAHYRAVAVDGDAVAFAEGGVAGPCVNTSIHDLYAYGTGRHMIGTGWVDGLTVRRAVGVKLGTGGIDLESNGTDQYVRNVLLEDIHIDCRRVALSAAGGNPVDDVTVRRFHVHGHQLGASSVLVDLSGPGTCNNWNISDFYQWCPTEAAYGMVFVKCHNVSIDRVYMNLVKDLGAGVGLAGVRFLDCTGTLSVTNYDFGEVTTPVVYS